MDSKTIQQTGILNASVLEIETGRQFQVDYTFLEELFCSLYSKFNSGEIVGKSVEVTLPSGEKGIYSRSVANSFFDKKRGYAEDLINKVFNTKEVAK